MFVISAQILHKCMCIVLLLYISWWILFLFDLQQAENLGFEELEEWALANRDPVPLSGKHELAENILNMFVR